METVMKKCFTSIVIAKFGETVCKPVADTYKEFGFKVVEKGIGWLITEAS